jgi:dehydrogenase/reductase SDR family protein 7B
MRNILITGANRGIGKALAIAFGQNGDKVIITARKAVAGNETLNELLQLGIDAHFYKMDVAIEEQINEVLWGHGKLRRHLFHF